MKYVVLAVGIAILGVSIWGYFDDKAYEDKCGNPKGSFDCVSQVREIATGELAMKDKFEIEDITKLLESKWFWGVAAGTALIIVGGLKVKKNYHPRTKSNVW